MKRKINGQKGKYSRTELKIKRKKDHLIDLVAAYKRYSNGELLDNEIGLDARKIAANLKQCIERIKKELGSQAIEQTPEK